MKRKKKNPSILYKKYLESHKDEKEKKELEEKLNADAVIVKKVSSGVRMIQLAADAARVLAKLLLTVFILALLSLAMTVLLNAPLRQMVFEYLGI